MTNNHIDSDTLAAARKALPKGTELYVIIDSVSSSGMSRVMRFYTIRDGALVEVTRRIEEVTGYNMNRRGNARGLRVNGAGMDMTFAVSYDLGMSLWSDGYAYRTPTAL